MTLAAPRLDDLTWEDLRLLAQRRIPAASEGRWTHHAAVDPGITLLELFAFLLEQQVFLLDQVPDALLHAVLRLLGEAAAPAVAATTVLVATPEAGAGPQRLQRGMAVRPLAGALAPLGFSLRRGCAVLPLNGLRLLAQGRDLTPDAANGPVALMPADGRAAVFDIVLRLAAPAPAASPEPLSLLLDIVVPHRVPPAWAPDSAAAPPPAELRVLDLSDGTARPLPEGAFEDGTRGLRRPGLLRVAWQAAWAARSEIRLRLATPAATFAEPPRLRAIAANAVPAVHAVRRVLDGRVGNPHLDGPPAAIASQLERWLPLSGLALTLPEPLGPALEGSIGLWLTGRDGIARRWRWAADLGPLGPTDGRFVFDRATGRLGFGDGYAGRVPAPATAFRLLLRTGGGEAGNLPPGLDWEADDLPAVALRNLVPAAGGREAEPPAEARDRVAGSLGRNERVVTGADIRDLVETMPGLPPHRAHVVAGLDPDFPCLHVPDAVTVFVAPRIAGAEAPRPDPGALALFRARLDRYRLVGTRIAVAVPRYRPVALEVRATGEFSDRAATASALEAGLRRYLSPDEGGPERDGWPFGRPLRPSELVRVAQDAVGAESFVERVAIGLDGAPAQEDCVEVPIGAHDLVVLAAFAAVLRPGEPPGGPPL